MNVLDGGWGVYLVLFLIAALAHEPWRWAGLAIGSRIDPSSDIFRWVKALSTSLVAALVARQVIFPAGALQAVPMWGRVAAFLVAIAVYLGFGRQLVAGIVAGSAMLILAKLVSG